MKTAWGWFKCGGELLFCVLALIVLCFDKKVDDYDPYGCSIPDRSADKPRA